MMYVAMNEDRISNPVILEIDPEVIYDENTKYADRNAVRIGAHVGGSLEDFKKIHFQTVKARNHFDFDVDDPKKPLSHAFLIKAYVEGLYPFSDKMCKPQTIEPKQLTLF